MEFGQEAEVLGCRFQRLSHRWRYSPFLDLREVAQFGSVSQKTYLSNGCPTRALTNLIGNTVEHGSPGSTVTVELGGDEDVEIMIHNRGAVIPADRLDGIFNPVKVSATPQKPSAQGPTGNLGLGLYIAERIVHAHGGRIEVESSEARGTTFTVHLPRDQ